MARKKIIFVIVEGPPDETTLGYALSKLCDKEQVYVHVVHYDNLSIFIKEEPSFQNDNT